jgi:Zn-dependent protease with chaperone function
MIELADRLYANVLEGLVLLGVNPAECAAVEMIRTATQLLVIAAALKIVADLAWQIRLRVRTSPCSDRRVLAIWSGCSARLDRRRGVELRCAPEGMPPVFTTGLIRPTIHISEELATRLSDEELQAVLLHELAHIERKDHIVTAWLRPSSLVGAAVIFQAFTLSFFFQPGSMHFGSLPAKLVLLSSAILLLSLRHCFVRPLEYLRETDCDDRAIVAGADPLALASAIVETGRLLRHRSVPLLRLLAHETLIPRASMAERRVRRLVNAPGTTVTLTARPLRLAGIAALAALLLFVASFHARSAASTNPKQGWSQIALP